MEYVPVSEPVPRSETQLVTLPVSTPPEFYHAESPADAKAANGSQRGGSQRGAPSTLPSPSHAVCRHCGVKSPPSIPRCFPADAKNTTTHDFGGSSSQGQNEGSKVHLVWQVLWLLIILGCYTVAIIFTVIPIQKYLTQDPVTVLGVKIGSAKDPLPFPAIQICNFNWRKPLEDVYVSLGNDFETQDLNFTISKFTVQVDDDESAPRVNFSCVEINNVATGGLTMNSTKMRVGVFARCPAIAGTLIQNDACDPLCDSTLDANATLTLVDPSNDPLGVSIAAFTPDGIMRQEVLDTGLFLPSGAFSLVSLKYSQTWRLDAAKSEDNFVMTSSAIKHAPNTYANMSGVIFRLDQILFTEISFSEMTYSQVNETKSYEAFNAFGDATAIVGFVTGFGVFGGPTVLTCLASLASQRFLRKLFYA